MSPLGSESPEVAQTGPLIAPAALPILRADQQQALQMAKRYCHDVTAKFLRNTTQQLLTNDNQSKSAEQQISQMNSLQDAANKQRALLLMSRIYVGSINFELGEDTVRTAFEPFGTIKTINMSWDSATMKHKGYAFVEYETAEAAQMALEQMNGVIVGGRNIKVGRPNNVPQAAPFIAQIQEEAKKYPRIYIASIHPDLTPKDVKSVFEAFGKIKKIELAPDSVPSKHRGWGYIDYENHKSSVDAIASMNLFDLGGKYLRVGRALTPPLPLYPPNAGPVIPSILTSAAFSTTPIVPSTTDSDLVITGSPSKMNIQFPASQSMAPATAAMPNSVAATNGESSRKSLAEIQAKLHAANEEKGLNQPEVTTIQQEEEVFISGSNARLMVMQNLSRKSESRVVVLRNMVSVEDLDEDLEYEVTSECNKYGSVERVVIYQEKQGVEEDAEVIIKIFVLFNATSEAEAAISSLDGRWFGGRVIKADLYDQSKFDNNDLSH